jgi:hypothetical protein
MVFSPITSYHCVMGTCEVTISADLACKSSIISMSADLAEHLAVVSQNRPGDAFRDEQFLYYKAYHP